MRVAFITTDNRDHCRQYDLLRPFFGPAPEAILAGLTNIPNLELHVISCTQLRMNSPAKLADNTWFHSLYVPKIGWLRTGYIGCILAVLRKLQEIQPDIVHAQGTERDCAISVALAPFPKVLTIHGNIRAIAGVARVPIFSFWWLQAKLEALVLPMFDGVFCNSNHTRSLVCSLAKKTWLVPNPLRLSFFSPLPASRPRIKPVRLLVIGTITPNKRPLELLRMMRSIYNSGVSFQVMFVGATGRSPYSGIFIEEAGKAKREGWLDFEERLPESDIIKLMDSSHALLHFPIEEAFGLVVAEALARGLKLFAAKVGGIVDITKGVQDAELFDADDWPDLEYSLKAWIDKPTSLSSLSRDLMESRYHPKVVATKHLEIYRAVLSGCLPKE
jgi:glycosyltransferase involved in cell wall biosynthesis